MIANNSIIGCKSSFRIANNSTWASIFLLSANNAMLGGSDQIILIANNSYLGSIQKQHFDRQHLNLIIVFSGENSLRSIPGHGFGLGPVIDVRIFRKSGRGPSHCGAMDFLGPSQGSRDEPLISWGPAPAGSSHCSWRPDHPAIDVRPVNVNLFLEPSK